MQTKAAALDKYRDWDVRNDLEWWDCVYEDAKRMASLIGIRIDEIWFSGFWNQGDGASFIGDYACAPDAMTDIKRETGGTDETLLRIATELTSIQTELKLRYGLTFECIVQKPYRGEHSGCMQTGYEDPDYEHVPDIEVVDTRVQEQMRAFADWVYKQLEQEHSYLTSDDHLTEAFADLRFDSAGVMI